MLLFLVGRDWGGARCCCCGGGGLGCTPGQLLSACNPRWACGAGAHGGSSPAAAGTSQTGSCKPIPLLSIGFFSVWQFSFVCPHRVAAVCFFSLRTRCWAEPPCGAFVHDGVRGPVCVVRVLGALRRGAVFVQLLPGIIAGLLSGRCRETRGGAGRCGFGCCGNDDVVRAATGCMLCCTGCRKLFCRGGGSGAVVWDTPYAGFGDLARSGAVTGSLPLPVLWCPPPTDLVGHIHYGGELACP